MTEEYVKQTHNKKAVFAKSYDALQPLQGP